jgi:divalent metal cation (Fe/Co/Zn/Cd) transporter
MLPLPLVERSERAIAHMIRRKVEGLKGVKDVRQVTARVSGKRLDVNMLVSLQDEIEGEDPHKISLLIEREVMREFPDARVTINTGPVGNVQDNVC